MTIGMLKGRASTVMKGNRLILMVGFVLSLIAWTLTAQVFINIFGMDRVFSFIDLFYEGTEALQWTVILLPLLLILLFLFGDMLHMSYRWFGLDLLNGKSPELKGVFQGFITENRKKLLSLVALRGFIVLGWSLLFILPGIWKAYLYSQAANCLKDTPSLSSMEALKQSEELMKGNRWKYALLQLLFSPWYLVPIGVFSFFLWSNISGLEVGPGMADGSIELVFSLIVALLLMLGILLLIFALYVEPFKMMTKQAFYEYIAHPGDEETYDDFEKELLKRQGLDRKKTHVTPKL
jgi:uncharacterized membrane protein